MAALAEEFFPGFYTWTFPGCPIQVRVRLEVVDVLQRLIETPQDPVPPPFRCGLLMGSTATAAVTEIVRIEPLAALDATIVEAAISKCEVQVVGFFRAVSGGSLQPSAGLRMSDEDVALANGFFHQPSSVVLLVETVQTGPPKAAFFFWANGKMLSDFSLMDFPLDSHQLAALERQRTARGARQVEMEIDVEPARASAPPNVSGWRARAAWIVGAIAILAVPAYFYSEWLNDRAALSANRTAGASPPAALLGFTVDRQGTDLVLSWDRHSPAVTSATFGVILIRENDQTRNIALTPDQLRAGSVRYKPVSDEVEIELNVATGDRVTRESVIAVLP